MLPGRSYLSYNADSISSREHSSTRWRRFGDSSERGVRGARVEDRPRDVRQLEALLEAGRLLGKHVARVLFFGF
ncbi:hypothetical protein V6Z11_D06G229200 [Gossypium hirsutum]